MSVRSNRFRSNWSQISKFLEQLGSLQQLCWIGVVFALFQDTPPYPDFLNYTFLGNTFLPGDITSFTISYFLRNSYGPSGINAFYTFLKNTLYGSTPSSSSRTLSDGRVLYNKIQLDPPLYGNLNYRSFKNCSL